jgi:hypothetical protein
VPRAGGAEFDLIGGFLPCALWTRPTRAGVRVGLGDKCAIVAKGMDMFAWRRYVPSPGCAPPRRKPDTAALRELVGMAAKEPGLEKNSSMIPAVRVTEPRSGRSNNWILEALADPRPLQSGKTSAFGAFAKSSQLSRLPTHCRIRSCSDADQRPLRRMIVRHNSLPERPAIMGRSARPPHSAVVGSRVGRREVRHAGLQGRMAGSRVSSAGWVSVQFAAN